jgi:hypothetical protein
VLRNREICSTKQRIRTRNKGVRREKTGGCMSGINVQRNREWGDIEGGDKVHEEGNKRGRKRSNHACALLTLIPSCTLILKFLTHT